jgi:anti-sigma factor RsiW
MSHRRIKNWIQEYVDHTLSSQKSLQVDEHLSSCLKCRELVKWARMTRGITIASRLEDECSPSSRFVPSVIAAIEQQKESYFFWSPVRLLALRAIPLMALLAFMLSAIAYRQLLPVLAAQGPEPSYVESYLDFSPSLDQERLIFSTPTVEHSEKPFSDSRTNSAASPVLGGSDGQ